MNILKPNFEKRGGLVTVVTQEIETNQVLMVAHTDLAGYLETLQTGIAVYYSTSRNERWAKGETSGDFQVVHDVLIDCDGDTIIYLVKQKGEGACHTKAKSCFYRRFDGIKIISTDNPIKEELLPEIDADVHVRLVSKIYPKWPKGSFWHHGLFG